MILLIDNYDSFTYNLVQVIGTINPDIKVIRNDAMSVEEIEKLKPSHIILSPGPGYPKDAGVCEEVVRKDIVQNQSTFLYNKRRTENSARPEFHYRLM